MKDLFLCKITKRNRNKFYEMIEELAEKISPVDRSKYEITIFLNRKTMLMMFSYEMLLDKRLQDIKYTKIFGTSVIESKYLKDFKYEIAIKESNNQKVYIV